jgi:hypothetical protein
MWRIGAGREKKGASAGGVIPDLRVGKRLLAKIWVGLCNGYFGRRRCVLAGIGLQCDGMRLLWGAEEVLKICGRVKAFVGNIFSSYQHRVKPYRRAEVRRHKRRH